MKIQVSAPGKIILCGEHSVVYGKKAIAVTLDKRTRVIIDKTSNNSVKYLSVNLAVERQFSLDKLRTFSESITYGVDDVVLQFIQKFLASDEQLSDAGRSAITAFLYLYLTLCETRNRPLFPLKVVIESELPMGAGLGSSASYSVCIAAGLLIASQSFEIAQLSLNEAQIEEISQWAYRLEKIFHGQSSGIDNTVCSYGHAVVLQSGRKTLSPKIGIIDAIVVNTNIPRNTRVLVKHVSELLEKFTDVIEPILQSMDAVVSRFENCLMASSAADYEELKELVQINQHLLCSIGVSHESLDNICRICSKHNLSAKLTGAGGGGCAYVLLPPDITSQKLETVTAELESFGYSCTLSSFGGPGVTLDLFDKS